MASQKSKMIAALLAFFLSAFAVDDFYVGNNTAGIIRLVILVLTVVIAAVITLAGLQEVGLIALAGTAGVIVLGSLILGIWGLINFIKYLVISDERFQEMVSANSRR